MNYTLTKFVLRSSQSDCLRGGICSGHFYRNICLVQNVSNVRPTWANDVLMLRLAYFYGHSLALALLFEEEKIG